MKPHYGLTLVEAPAREPLTDAEVLLHLRVEPDQLTDFELIKALAKTARQWWEDASRLSLITQTWDIIFDCFPDATERAILLPKNPLQSVASIQYYNTAGALQTWDSSEYLVDKASRVARIMPAYGQVWPYTRNRISAVIIRTIVGFGDTGRDVPAGIIAGMKLLIGSWYENREHVVLGRGETPYQIPMGVDALLNANRIMEFV
jgi:uncharacterized phiE125 gp8 family phage protein